MLTNPKQFTTVQDLRVWKQYCWTFKPSGMGGLLLAKCFLTDLSHFKQLCRWRVIWSSMVNFQLGWNISETKLFCDWRLFNSAVDQTWMMIMNYWFGNKDEGVHILRNYIHIGLKPRLPLQKQHSTLFTSKFKLKELLMWSIWCMALCDGETLESFERWCWRRMDISWNDHIRNEKVWHTGKERNIPQKIRECKANWMGHILCRNCILNHVHEGKIEGMTEVIRWERRCKLLLHDLNERIMATERGSTRLHSVENSLSHNKLHFLTWSQPTQFRLHESPNGAHFLLWS
jgi:hypothetical protein